MYPLSPAGKRNLLQKSKFSLFITSFAMYTLLADVFLQSVTVIDFNCVFIYHPDLPLDKKHVQPHVSAKFG